jgi:hypothetical protein
MVRAERDGPIVIGGHGVRYLADDRVVGHDPAVPYGKHAVESLVRLDAMDHCGDLVAISMIDPETDEVAAFEELIGSHGGLGGWQTKGLIIHPADWQVDGPLVGAPAVYRQIRTWLEAIGIRFGPQPEPESAADAA